MATFLFYIGAVSAGPHRQEEIAATFNFGHWASLAIDVSGEQVAITSARLAEQATGMNL